MSTDLTRLLSRLARAEVDDPDEAWPRAGALAAREGRVDFDPARGPLLPRLRAWWAEHPEDLRPAPLFQALTGLEPAAFEGEAPGFWHTRGCSAEGRPSVSSSDGVPLRVRAAGILWGWVPAGIDPGPSPPKKRRARRARGLDLEAGFYLALTPLTRGQVEALPGVPSPWTSAEGACDPTLPATHISYPDAIAICAAVAAAVGERVTARPPTEEEWEFAATAGRPEFPGRSRSRDYAWGSQNSGNQPAPVAKKRANDLGLFDVLGNVWEHCLPGDRSAPEAGRVVLPGGRRPEGPGGLPEAAVYARFRDVLLEPERTVGRAGWAEEFYLAPPRVLRGGSYAFAQTAMDWIARQSATPWNLPTYGLRPALLLPGTAAVEIPPPGEFLPAPRG